MEGAQHSVTAAAVRERNRAGTELTPHVEQCFAHTVGQNHLRPIPSRVSTQLVLRNSWSRDPEAARSKTTFLCIALYMGTLGWESDNGSGEAPVDTRRPRSTAVTAAAPATTTLTRLYCWRRPKSLAMIPSQAVERIGEELQVYYERVRRDLGIRVAHNAPLEDLKDCLRQMRRVAGTDKILFHYLGHGLPRPDANCFHIMNSKGSAIPIAVDDFVRYIGFPHVLVFDCPSASAVMLRCQERARKVEEELQYRFHQSPIGSKKDEFPTSTQPGGGAGRATGGGANTQHLGDWYFLGACEYGEALPSHPLLPNDIFTTCLLQPIKMALLWYCIQTRSYTDLHPAIIHLLPGNVDDRKTFLGQLKVTFITITECIAWSITTREQFTRLFRDDQMLMNLFRNFLLAQRIIENLGATPWSYPALHGRDHPLWLLWDGVLDRALGAFSKALRPSPHQGRQLSIHELRASLDEQKAHTALPQLTGLSDRELQDIVSQAKPIDAYYTLELTSLHALCDELEVAAHSTDALGQWANTSSRAGASSPLSPNASSGIHISRLPVIMQGLCLLTSRYDSLHVLSRLIDRGLWSVDQFEQIRLFSETYNRLWTNQKPELRELITFVAAKCAFYDEKLIPLNRRKEALAYLLVVLKAPCVSKARIPDVVGPWPPLGLYSCGTGQRLLAASAIALLVADCRETLQLLIHDRGTLFPVLADLLDIAKGEEDPGYLVHRLKVVGCALLLCVLHGLGSGGEEPEDPSVVTPVITPLCFLLHYECPQVRTAAVRCLHALLSLPCIADSPYATEILRAIFGFAKRESDPNTRVGITHLLLTAAKQHQASFKTMSPEELKRFLTPALRVSKPPGSSGSGSFQMSPMVVLPAAMESGARFENAVLGASANEDDEVSDSANTRTPLTSSAGPSPALSPHTGGSSGSWVQMRSGSSALWPEASTPSRRFSSPFMCTSLAEDVVGGNDTSIGVKALQLLGAWSADPSHRVKVTALRAIQDLTASGCLPTALANELTQPDEAIKANPKSQGLAGIFGGMLSKGGTGPKSNVPQNKPSSSYALTPELRSGSSETGDYFDELRPLNLEDPTGAVDVVNSVTGFLGANLLTETTDADVLHPFNVEKRRKLERFTRQTTRYIDAALHNPPQTIVQKTTVDSADGKVAIFHPTLPLLISAGGGSTHDVVTVLHLEERAADIRQVHSFRTSVVAVRTDTNAMYADPLLSPTHSISSQSVGTDRTPRAGSFGAQNTGGSAGTSSGGGAVSAVTAANIIDVAYDPKLVLASGDGSISIFANFCSPGTYHLTSFPTLPHELALNSHHCDASYQPFTQRLHVTGFGGSVSTWDLNQELLVDERRETSTIATAIAASFDQPAVFAAGFHHGHVLLFDTRLSGPPALRLDGLPRGVRSVTFDRLSPYRVTAACASGVVAIWDPRRVSAGRVPTAGTYPIHQSSQGSKTNRTKSEYSALDDYSAIDIHSISYPQEMEPFVVSASVSRSRVSKGRQCLRKVSKGLASCCTWHPYRYRCAILYPGGKVAIFEQQANTASDTYGPL